MSSSKRSLPIFLCIFYGRAYDEQYLMELKRSRRGKKLVFTVARRIERSSRRIAQQPCRCCHPSTEQAGGLGAPFRTPRFGPDRGDGVRNPCNSNESRRDAGGSLPGEAGLLVEPGSVEELSEAINSLANQGSIWKELSAAGLSQVREKFNWDVVVDNV